MLMAIVVAAIVYFVTERFDTGRIAILKDRIGYLDDQLADYRSHLKGATPEDAERQMVALSRKLGYAERQIYALIPHPAE